MLDKKVPGHYLGIDVDPRSIEYCKKMYHPDSFILDDFADHDFGKFDLVFCIEVIEHVPEVDRPYFLNKVIDLADRAAFISTPDKRKPFLLITFDYGNIRRKSR